MILRLSEWIAIAYLMYLIGAAGFGRLAASSTSRTVVRALLTIFAVLWLSLYESGIGLIVRNLAPAVYLLMMYWLPAELVVRPNVRFERFLMSTDWRWLAGTEDSVGARLPKLVIETLELSYLLCYPLIPLGIACLYAAGAEADADRYWTAVLLAGGLSYGFLPWLPTRPPRATDARAPRASTIRDLNMRVVRRTAVGWNTFPSGHVATAFAAALAVFTAAPIAGAALVVLAGVITVAASVGRYHYAADIAAGLIVALLGFAVSRLG